MLAIVKWDLKNIQCLACTFWQMVSMLFFPTGIGWGLVKRFYYLTQCSLEGKINKTNRPVKLMVVSVKSCWIFAFENCFPEIFLDVSGDLV